MAQRKRREGSRSGGNHVLSTGEVAEKGKMACLDTTSGEVVAGQASTTLKPLGHFDADATGDGTTTIYVRYFRERRLFWWANDGTDPVDAADEGSNCYIVDDETVSISSATSTRSIAGRVFGVSTRYGVLVEMAD